jgi:hypothetical protein
MNTNCAPGKNFEEGSCLTKTDLHNIIEEFNTVHKSSKPIKKVEEKRYLLKEVDKAMQNKYNCNENDQVCWIESKLMKNNKNDAIHLIANETFRPVGPKGKRDWLSTADIDKVMLQYEAVHSKFKFFGAVPYDFDALPQLDIHHVNFEDLVNRGKTKIGMVINLDTHDMSGSHWVALYCDLLKNQIYYFDSIAKKPGKRLTKTIRKILTFMHNRTNNTNVVLDNNMCRKIIRSRSNKYHIRYNNKQHQFKNSECGVYSMNFIIRLLNGETFKEIRDDIMKDDHMNRCRGVYFRNFKKD